MFYGSWKLGMLDEGYEKVKFVREKVFVEENGIPASEEYDRNDEIAAHLYVEQEDGTPIAAARMYPDGKNTVIGRIAVMKDFRAESYYEFCLRMLLYKGQTIPNERIVTEVPTEFAGLYEKFGFSYDSEPFMTRGEMHVAMSVPSDGITWFSDCGGKH